MNVLSIEKLGKTVNDSPLFCDVTLGLEEGECVGIVGRNGAGKTTFLNVIAGITGADEGRVSRATGSNLVTLTQNVVFREGATLRDYLYESGNKYTELLLSYEKALKEGNEKLYNGLQSRIEHESLWDIETSYKAYLSKFGIDFPLDKPMEELSGGERKKVALARLFALRPTIMLLDEPTNHLDIRTIEILENELRASEAAVVIVTHDRYILNSVCTTIWELDGSRFYRHPGSYESYLERRAERIAMLQKEQDRLASILRRELVWLARGPQARTGKDKNRKERIEGMLSLVRNVQDVPQTAFSSVERRLGKKILEIDDVGKGFGDRKLFSGFSYAFKKGDRIGVIGDNGSGKSTLLDIIAGLTEPDCGHIDKGVNTFISYYDQLGRSLPRHGKTALEYLEDISSRVVFAGREISAERLLELFGFSRTKMRTDIGVYSGGERRRLYLISKLMANPNFLMLDEPTNDLDIQTMENLEEYLASFSGVSLIVSHDRAFLNCTCSSLFVIEDGQVHNVPTTYSDWRRAKGEEQKKTAPAAAAPQRPKREKKGLSYKERKEMEALEAEIEALEEEKARLEASFSDPGTTLDGSLAERSRRYEELGGIIEEKSTRYFFLAEQE